MTLLFALLSSALATSPRWSYEEAYDNVAGGSWYMGEDNEEASLAWGESYVMMSLATMFETTADPVYLDRLAEHVDAVLAQRDVDRGVTDYRGVSGPCWRDVYYSEEPYCYVVHSGMIGFPIAEFAALVREHGIEEHPAADGEAFGDKADRYVAAVTDLVAFHEDQWRGDGTYVFREDADFTGYPGVAIPYNQANAMGRLLLALFRATGDTALLDKVEALAAAFREGISTGSQGEYLWNYWGGSYVPNGEDISHAFINVAFAAEAAREGIEFDDTDMWAFSETMMSNVYVDEDTIATYVGGGETNYSSYPLITALWLDLSPWRASVYGVARNQYEAQVDPTTLGSGWLLLGWAQLAEQQPPLCAHFFYSVDWEDQGDWRQATAYSANILTVPPDLDQACLVPLEVQEYRALSVQQWDGAAYHPVARWTDRSGTSHRLVPYEPAWPFEYWEEGVLFQFADAFVAGEGVMVAEPQVLTAPTITSEPPDCVPGETWRYAPTGEGDAPWWWSLREGPPGARVDAASGELSWEATEPCEADFRLVLDNDVGADEQTWSFAPPDDTGGGDEGGEVGGDEGGDAGGDEGSDEGSGQVDTGGPGPVEPPVDEGCACSSLDSRAASSWAALALLMGLSLRRRRPARSAGSLAASRR